MIFELVGGPYNEQTIHFDNPAIHPTLSLRGEIYAIRFLVIKQLQWTYVWYEYTGSELMV